jgi:hypothetical protein
MDVSSDHQRAAEAMNTGLPREPIGSRVAGEPVQGLDGAADLAGDCRPGTACEADYATRRSWQDRQRLAATDNYSSCTNRHHNRQIGGPTDIFSGPLQSRRTVGPKTAKVEFP